MNESLNKLLTELGDQLKFINLEEDYQIGATEFPYNQLQLADKLNEIEKVAFRSLYYIF